MIPQDVLQTRHSQPADPVWVCWQFRTPARKKQVPWGEWHDWRGELAPGHWKTVDIQAALSLLRARGS